MGAAAEERKRQKLVVEVTSFAD